ALFLLVFSDPQYGQECLLRNVHFADAFHSLLAFLLLLQQLTLSRYVASVTFGKDIFAQGTNTFARDDLRANGGLDCDLELLPRDELPHLGDQRLAAVVGEVTMDNYG